MARSGLSLQAQFWIFWETHFFLTAQISFFFFRKIGRPKLGLKYPLPPFATHILNRLDVRIHLEASKIYHTYKKKLSKSRLSDPFFGRFLVISELGSRIYIVKSAILIFWVFLPIFLHEITLQAIDIDNIGCLEPFLPLWEHFWNRVSVQLNCASDLTLRHIGVIII